MTNVDKRVRARFGGHLNVMSYELGSPIYIESHDTIRDVGILHELGPSNARQLAAALFAAANVAEGKPISEENQASLDRS